SEELDTSATVWPTVGDAGNHLKDATGGPGVPCAGLLTVNVTGRLTPTFPAESPSLACTVYVPGPRPAKTTDQLPATAPIVNASSTDPLAAGPAKTSSVMAGRSPASLPAVPENTWDSEVVELPFEGEEITTCGGVVSTLKVTRGLFPGSSKGPLVCSAIAV